MERVLSEDEQERLERDADAAIVAEIEENVDQHGALIKHCLQALVVAGVSLDCATAAALQELGMRLQQKIHAALDYEE